MMIYWSMSNSIAIGCNPHCTFKVGVFLVMVGDGPWQQWFMKMPAIPLWK